jgi:hypothetical protein
VDASGAPAKLAAINLTGELQSTGWAIYGITFTNNAMLTELHGTYSSTGNGAVNCTYGTGYGAPMIESCWQKYVFGGNCFVDNGTITWPGTNVTSVASLSALFTNYNNGNGGNYALASDSECRGAATDGSDPGADAVKVASVIGGNHP